MTNTNDIKALKIMKCIEEEKHPILVDVLSDDMIVTSLQQRKEYCDAMCGGGFLMLAADYGYSALGWDQYYKNGAEYTDEARYDDVAFTINNFQGSTDDLRKELAKRKYPRISHKALKQWILEAAYAYRFYTLLHLQHEYEDKRKCNLEIINGELSITYYDISKYDILKGMKELSEKLLDEDNFCTGGLHNLVHEFPELLKEVSYKKLNSEQSVIKIKLCSLKNIKDENFADGIILSVLNTGNIIMLIDRIAEKYMLEQRSKFVIEELMFNLVMHNFSVPKPIDIVITKQNMVRFESSK